jgi:murein DD-endopeptidase MepM/ murein hydrolase activator NlpD
LHYDTPNRSAYLHILSQTAPKSSDIKLTLTISDYICPRINKPWMADQGSFVFEGKSQNFAMASAAPDGAIASAIVAPQRVAPRPGWREKLAKLDLVPDLGEDIGSVRWFRGLATLTLLSLFALALLPSFGPVYGAQAPMPTAVQLEMARTQTIMPLAYGGDTGGRMAAVESVTALAGSPERPSIEITATLGQGDSFARVLQRAGVGANDARTALALISGAASLSDITPGTRVAVVLGRRTSKDAPRPLESLDFRARFDLRLAVNRAGGGLQLSRTAIAVDDTPLRIRGLVGGSLYRSARAAGAPADVIQDYLKIIAGRTALTNIGANDEFDIIVAHRRAETGEVQIGDLLYAGIDRGGKPRIQMLKWRDGDNSQWFEASGVGETRGQMSRPVNGPQTSGFGYRRHPILGYKKMHTGIDFGAPHGAPIYAASDGVVTYAARKGGYGNFVQIDHGGGLATGYGHMSRIASRAGQRVRQGQIIGYVGSTGLSTGPHLHYEMYRGGRHINPASVSFTQRAQLSGGALAQFRAQLARLKSVKPGAAMAPMGSNKKPTSTPGREIDRISMAKSRNAIS